MRLVGGAPLSGQLDPVRLDFSSDQLVYPMRMSAVAKDTQRVTIYTLGQHRMQRTDADASRQDVTVDYAGSIEGRTTDRALTELSAKNPYLTKISTTITEPSSIATDFIFSPPPPPTTTRISASSGRDDGDADVGAFLVALGASVIVVVLAAAVGTIWFVRYRRSARVE